MGWVKLADDFARHPKVVGLSDAAFRAYVEALCYAAEYETDGDVPDAVAANGPVRSELLDVGLWEHRESGISIHDYLVYNASHAQRIAKRIAASNAASKRYALTGEGSGGGFDEFWAHYPRKIGKRAALLAFERAVKRAPAEAIIEGAKRFAADPNLPLDRRFIPHPATWLNQDRWEDEPLPPRDPKPGDLEREAERQRRLAEAERIAAEGRYA